MASWQYEVEESCNLVIMCLDCADTLVISLLGDTMAEFGYRKICQDMGVAEEDESKEERDEGLVSREQSQ